MYFADAATAYAAAPDDDVLKHLALTYSQAHPVMTLGEACDGNGNAFQKGITNGADWYSVFGMICVNYFCRDMQSNCSNIAS